MKITRREVVELLCIVVLGLLPMIAILLEKLQ